VSQSYRLAPLLSVVEAGASFDIGDIVARHGMHALVLGGRRSLSAAEGAVSALTERLDAVDVRPFTGECTDAAIERTSREAEGHNVIVGVGGGKALDTAKAAASSANIPCVTIPTSAATCAAYTPLSILHSETGTYAESRRLPCAVAAMILDPALIVSAPPRTLASGIVDGVARAFDTILAARNGTPTTTAALSLAICNAYLASVLVPLGERALADNARGEATDVYTRVIEACIVGAGLAGETGARLFGRSFSHAVAYALSHVVNPDVVLHGEAVGLGVLVHCALDPEPPVALDRILALYDCWGLPRTFEAIGIHGIDGDAGCQLAERILGYLDLDRAVPFPVGTQDIHRALLATEAGATA